MAAGHDEDEAVARHLAAHAVMLALPGIPALYVHSLFGTSNDHAGYAATGIPRRLNRVRFGDADALARRITAGGREARVLAGLRRLVGWRAASAAFHPDAALTVRTAGSGRLTLQRAGSATVTVEFVPPYTVSWAGHGL